MTKTVSESECESIGDLYQRASIVLKEHWVGSSADHVVDMVNDGLSVADALTVDWESISFGVLSVFSISQSPNGKLIINCNTVPNHNTDFPHQCRAIIGPDCLEGHSFEGCDFETYGWVDKKDDALAICFMSACLTGYENAVSQQNVSTETI